MSAAIDQPATPGRGLVVAGLLAGLAAVVATAAGAALARAAGVDLEVSGGERIPVSGIAVVTGFFSLVGLALAALFRWSRRPAAWFVRVTVALTALSLAPPVLAAADAGTAVVLVVLHLAAAAVVVPALARSLSDARPPAPRAPSAAQRDPATRGS